MGASCQLVDAQSRHQSKMWLDSEAGLGDGAIARGNHRCAYVMRKQRVIPVQYKLVLESNLPLVCLSGKKPKRSDRLTGTLRADGNGPTYYIIKKASHVPATRVTSCG